MSWKKSYKDYLYELNSKVSSMKGQQQSFLHYQQINGWDKPDVYESLLLSIHYIELVIERLKTFPEYKESDISKIITDHMSMSDFLSFKGEYIHFINSRSDNKKLIFRPCEFVLELFENSMD